MARTKNQEGACSTPVKGQVNHSHLSKNQGSQQCDVEGDVNSTIPTKKGNVSTFSSKFGKRSRSSSPRQQDLSPRRSLRTGVSQEPLCQTELSVLDPTVRVNTDHTSLTPSQKFRWKKRSPGNTGETDVSKTSSTYEDHAASPKSASPNLNFNNLSEAKSGERAVDEGRIFVYQNVKHAISELPGGTKTSGGTSTPIVCIRDVLQGDEEAKVAGSGTLSGSELRKHLLKSLITTGMANEEPNLAGNKKKVSPKKGSMQTHENHELAKNLPEKPIKTKVVTKSHSEKKENLKNTLMLLKECPPKSPSNGTKPSPNLDQIEKVKNKKKKRSPSSTIPMEMKSMSDTFTTDTRPPGDSGPVEITLNNGDQLPIDTGPEDISGSLPLSTSPTPPKDGDLRHGRRIRSPSVRYADDMILFPLKSPRKSPKFGNSRDGGSPEDKQDKTPEREKPNRMAEGEKLTKTAECQTSELYALLTRTLSNDKIITPSRRKSPVETTDESEKCTKAKKVTGAVREIDFSEGVKTNTRDSQIQVQMEEHLANVHKEELTRLRNEFSTDTDNISSQSTSAVGSYHRNTIEDSRQFTDITLNPKQKNANKNVSKPCSSKVSDSKLKSSIKKESKQMVSKQTDPKQKCVLKSDKKQYSPKPTDIKQSVSELNDSKQSENKSEHLMDSEQVVCKQFDGKQKSSNRSVPKQSVSKQSESRQLDSKQNGPKIKSSNKSFSKEIHSEERLSVKNEPKKMSGKIDSKHKVKTKHASKQMDDSVSPLKQGGHIKSKHKSNVDSEHACKSKSDFEQNGDKEKLQCDKPQPKHSCVMDVKTDLKSNVECDSQQSARVKCSSDKDVAKKKNCKEDKHNGSGIHGVSDGKHESEKPTDNYKSDKETDTMETSIKSDSTEKSDSVVSQKPKTSNLFSLISRVKSNLECPNPLTEFLNSPLYDPAPSGDDEEEISDESLIALDNDDKKLSEESDHSFDKDKIGSTDKLLTEIPENKTGIESGSTSTKDNATEKLPQMRKNDQNKNSLEDLLNSGGQDERGKSHETERVTRRSQNKNNSPGRVTRAQTSPEKHQPQTRLSRRYNSPDKNTIYPADVILVNSATSSSDNIKSVSSDGQKSEEKVDNNQSSTVTSTDADSTTGDSPARKNIFDLLMCSYKPGEKEGEEEEEEKEPKGSLAPNNQDTSGSVTDKLTSYPCIESGNAIPKKESDSDRSKKDLQLNESAKKESKSRLPDTIETVDLTCDEDGFESDEAKRDEKRHATPQMSLTGVGFKSSLTGSSTASNVLRGQTGFTCHDTPDHPKITEPRPLEVLKSVEMDTPDKMSAFQSKSLDEYLRKMKKQNTPAEPNDNDDEDEDEDDDDEEEEEDEEDEEEEEEEEEEDEENVENEEDEEDEQREFEEELEPDFDEVDGMVFVSFPSEETLSAHIEVERKTRIGKNENLLLGISRLRNLRKKREHIQMKYNKRIHRLKALKAQGQMNQNLRGMHKALEKYQKLYRTELYMILKSKNKDVNFKSPQKTSDITKIKGWKKKFGNTEQLAEATGLPISQAGKLHWRTEARLLKNLKPDELKEIGLNLKKKRRKNLVFTIRKGMSKGDNRSDRNEDGTEYDDAEGEGFEEDNHEDDFKDDMNRDDSWFEDFNISPEKEKKSQYMKKQERLKKRLMLQSLSFGPEEETIIRKLGGQRSLRKSVLGLNTDDRPPSLEEVAKGKRGRKRKGEVVTLTTVSHSMALSALEALDGRFVKEMPKPPPVPKTVSPVKEEKSDRLGLQEDSKDFDEEWLPPVESTKEKKKRGRKKKRRFFQKIKEENAVQCDQPGCRYGCICHLCKFADPVPDSDSRPSQDTPCDKEYCRLGCICDSIGARGHESLGECQKPECQNGCGCIKEEQMEGTEEEKRQRQKAAQKRFEALPRRQSTYRLAKNLDAVSRKAMLYYESSEMYCTEQSTRKRKSKEVDDLPVGQHKTICHTTGPGQTSASNAVVLSNPVTSLVSSAVSGTSSQQAMKVVPSTATDTRMNRYVISAGQIKSSNGTLDDSRNSKPASKASKPTGRNDPPWYHSNSGKSKKKDEVNVRRTEFDDITFDEMLESDNEESVEITSCARTVVYKAIRRNKQRCTCHAENCAQSSASCQGVKATELGAQKSKTAEVGDSLSPIVISPGNTPPSSPSAQSSNSTRLSGCNGSKNMPTVGAKKAIHTGWHTQWVCLKTSKKKSEDEEESYEIRLLEMISNCNWENAKQKILSKISNQISREHYPNPRQMIVGDFFISFLPRSDKPAVIPPEVKAKLPKSIFSIRIKVEKRSQVLKTRLGEFITAQEKILKPSLESQDVIAIDVPPTTTTSSSLVSGGISGLSHLQIKGHTSSSTLKWIPVPSTAGKTVTSPSQVSPQGVSSLSSVLLKPGMSTKVGAPSQGTVGKSQSNNLVILQNPDGQKYVLASPVTQPSQVQLVSAANSSSPVISSGVSQILTQGTSVDSLVSTSTSTTTVVSSCVPVMISTMISASGSQPASSSAMSIVTNPSVCTSTPNIPAASVGIPLNKQLPPKVSILSPINKNVPQPVSPANAGITLIASNVPQSNCSKIGSTTSVSGSNVINMTFTLPGKNTSHSTVTTHSVPVSLLANTQAITMVTVATSVTPASSVKTVLSSIPPGSLLTQASSLALHPSVKIGDMGSTSTRSGIMSKLVPIVPKMKQDMEVPQLKKILIPISTATSSSSSHKVPVAPSNQSKVSAEKFQQMLNASRERAMKNEVVVVKEMRFGPSDNKELVTKNTKEQGDVMFHSFVMSRPQGATTEETKQGMKRKKQTMDGDSNRVTVGDTEEKKKKKKKKKKLQPSEGDDGGTNPIEEGKQVTKKRKKKKSENNSDGALQSKISEISADIANDSSPPTKKCRNDSTDLAKEESLISDSAKEIEKTVLDEKCGKNGSNIMETNTMCGENSGRNSGVIIIPECDNDIKLDAKSDKVICSDSSCNENSISEPKCIGDPETTSDSLEITEIKSVKDTDSTCDQKKKVATDLHSVLFSQIENSIREYDGQDKSITSEYISHKQCDSLTTGKPNTSEVTVIKQCTPTTVNTTTIGETTNKPNNSTPGGSQNNSSPAGSHNTCDEVDGKLTVSSKDDLTDAAVCVASRTIDQLIALPLDSPSQFEMDTESSEGDHQSCETSQNSLNDLKMLATVQKASVDVLQIIEGTKNPQGAKHPLVPVVTSREEEENKTHTGKPSIQNRVTIPGSEECIKDGLVEKLVGKSMEIVNSIRHHIDLSQDKIRETKLQTGDVYAQEEKTQTEPKEEDESWESRMSHEGCDDVVISLSDDETDSPDAENSVSKGISSTAKGESGGSKNSIGNTEAEPEAVIVIDDEDKPSNSIDKQQVTAPSIVKSNRVIPPAIDEVDITTVDENENDGSDIDIENASDEETGSNQLWSYLIQEKQKVQPSSCSIHSHKGKRKASLDTIDNMLKHSVEFKEGIVKSSKNDAGKSKERNTRHSSMEKQRRRDLKNGFKDLIEVIFGQDESGQKKPLCVETIQGASKIKVLHMALNMIKQSEEKCTVCLGTKESLKVQNEVLQLRLDQSRRDLITSGMAAGKIQDILSKISKTCQFIFAKREMLMKKRLDTQKVSQDSSTKSDTKAEEKLDLKPSVKSKKPNPKSKTKPLQSQKHLKTQSVTPILPKGVPYTAVPVQLVSTAQVLQMAQINQRAQPEIYIDNAEERGTPIKQERLSEDEYGQELPLQIANSWSQQEGRQGVSNSVGTKPKVSNNSASECGKEKVDEEELERMNTQSPVFSDVDISENYFVQQDQDDEVDNMDVGIEDPLASSHTSSDMEYKVIDTSSHSEVMVGYIPDDSLDLPSQDGVKLLEDAEKPRNNSDLPSEGVS
ncbi:uncharacterized protein LOC117329256 [Pecten maximus]|uniref:uncharacterized protein LOC117329256 n=1 Tax=Pecten maximus TaxID=6579 RepID=UPI001458A9AE|nr:uncharacterized protein LOC117329256 [Pecten maximus]